MSIRGPLGIRDFRLLWSSQVGGSIGDVLLGSAIGYWFSIALVPVTSLPAVITGVSLALSLPRLLIAPVAGVVADRADRRVVMAIADTARCAIIIALSLVILLSSEIVTPVAVVVIGLFALWNACGQLYQPSRAGLAQALLPDEQRDRASSLTVGALTTVAAGVGATGPVLVETIGMPLTAGLCALFSALSLSYVIRLSPRERVGERRPQRPWMDISEALREAIGNAQLRVLFAGLIIYAVTLGINSVALPLFALKTVSLSPVAYGLLLGIFPLGNLAGVVLSARCAPRLGRVRAFVGSVVLLGASYIAYSFARTDCVVIALMGVIGILFGVFAVTQVPILQAATPPQLIGRISALNSFVLGLGSAVASVAAGAAFTTLAARDRPDVYAAAIGLSGILLLLGGTVIALAGPRRGTPGGDSP